MPFYSSEPTEEFVYVNPEDPDGKRGLKPFSWNLETEVVSGKGTENEVRKVKLDKNGEPIRIERGDSRFSYWNFAAHMRQTDRSTIDRKVSRTSISIDPKKQRKLGRDYRPEIKSDNLMDAVTALLTTMSRGWHGEEFIIPSWWKDKNHHTDGRAGTLAPCTREWIETRHPLELAVAEHWLSDLYEPMSEDEEEAVAQDVTREEFLSKTHLGVAGPESS